MKNNKNIFLFFYLIIFALYLQAQSPQVKLPETFNNLTLDSFAAKVSDEYKIRIFYDATLMPDVIITFSEGSNEIIDVLQSNLKAYNIEVLADENGNIFLAKDLTLKTRLPDDFFAISQSSTDNRISKNEFADRESFLKTNHEYISKTFIVGTKKAGVYKSEAEITGRILSFNDSLPLVGATLYIDQLQKGAASDVDGFYTITIPKGKYNLKVRNVGYEETSFKVDVLSSGTQDFYILKKVFLMETVEIRSEADHNVKSVQMGVEKISIKDIKEIPTVLGERDIIKVALLLPGVQSIGEGSSGFNVRGSPSDQNILAHF